MNEGPKGGDLFIVDNSISGWTGLRYLTEWAELAKSFDVATGYFEIGGLLAMEDKWQKLDKIRILMGDETTARSKRAILEAIRSNAEVRLDASLEVEKSDRPFLEGVAAIEAALHNGRIECRVYNKDKFHAKAYITHAKVDVIGAQALVGSSNFTRPGLTKSIELNIQVQSGREVAQLQDWFNHHWDEAEEVTEDILKVIERHTEEHTPFEIYAKALQEYFRGHELTSTEWDETRSKMFPVLDQYQKEAYWALNKIARQHGGAFLCDGVGLGKTFVGLMLIERLVLHEGKNVVLFAPKAAKEGVWEPLLRRFLPHLGGSGRTSVFSNLAVFSHTDLVRTSDFPEAFERVAERADAIIIDEAHHFRNTGTQGDPETGERRSRYWRLFDALDPEKRPKTVFMLTATPINNRLTDFRHMAELFSRRDDAFFARTLGVGNLTAYFRNLERRVIAKLNVEGAGLGDHIAEAQELFEADDIFRELVVQRSRAYAKDSQIREKGTAAAFPERQYPQVAEYSIRKTYGRLLEQFESAFARTNPLFSLPIYYPLHYYIGDDDSIDPLSEGRQKQVVGLIRTQFLKRFESSVRAFEMSCDRLLKKLLAFLEVHSESDAEKSRLERWKRQNDEVLGYIYEKQIEMWPDGEDAEEDADEDIVPPEFLEAVEELTRDEYDIAEIMAETYLDLDQIVAFLEETRKFEPRHDDKLQKLIRLLNSKALKDRKVLIFTEFADTARYLRHQLRQAGVEGIEQIDGSSKLNRASVIRRFSPYYNDSSPARLAEKGEDEIRILISTDVLSEGLNLQDASRMINYDIHWNPVRLMQRIGRVDRRMDPEIEEALKADYPEVAADRGKVAFWNFLPPDELNSILTLYERVTHKTLLISQTFGIEGRKLFTPSDDFEALKEFNEAYEGEKTVIEEMHLEFQDMLRADLGLEARLNRMPGAAFSGREKLKKGMRGVFFCYALPALDRNAGEFTEEAGTTRWYFYNADRDEIVEGAENIVESVRSVPETPRRVSIGAEHLLEIRGKVLKHITDSYLKRVDAPVGVKPQLRCWMELTEG